MNDKSKHAPSKDMSHRQKEDEGNRTAARRHSRMPRQFTGRGKVDEKAHGAEEALHGVDRFELEHAELVGRRHVAEEDPAAKKRRNSDR
jgi:hypothetical protein